MKTMRIKLIIFFIILLPFLNSCRVKPSSELYKEAMETIKVGSELAIFERCEIGVVRIKILDPDTNAVVISDGAENIISRFYPTEVSYAKRTGLYAFEDKNEMTKITAKLLDDDKVIWSIDGIPKTYVFKEYASRYKYHEESPCLKANSSEVSAAEFKDFIGRFSFKFDTLANPPKAIKAVLTVDKDKSVDYIAVSGDDEEYFELDATEQFDDKGMVKSLLLHVSETSKLAGEVGLGKDKIKGFDSKRSSDFGNIVIINEKYFLVDSKYLTDRFLIEKDKIIPLNFVAPDGKDNLFDTDK